MMDGYSINWGEAALVFGLLVVSIPVLFFLLRLLLQLLVDLYQQWKKAKNMYRPLNTKRRRL